MVEWFSDSIKANFLFVNITCFFVLIINIISLDTVFPVCRATQNLQSLIERRTQNP